MALDSITPINTAVDLLQPCSAPGCAALVTAGRCAEHQREFYRSKPQSKEKNKRYGSDWRRLRAWHIRRFPFCALCLIEGKTVAADEVDHKIPVAVAPHRRLDADNLQSLCRPHHYEKTARENRGDG